ncbi:hypothetical protein ACOMHN_056179 [Nucella lapillus]
MAVLLLAVLQLTVYYWVIAPGKRRNRTPALSHLHPLLLRPQQRLQKTGTCDESKCPAVKEDMLNVHLIPHSHDDVGWLKTADQYYTGEYPKSNFGEYIFIEGKQCVRCVLNTTVTELLKNPDRRFIFIEMAFFSRYWNEIDDNTRQQVKKLIERRQLEIVLGGWVMSDAAVTHYADLIDQHTLGFDFLQSTLGPCAQSRVAWHVDQFGHSREHAALFAKMGFDALFVGRIDYQDHEERKKTKTLEFVWETSANAPDDTGHLFTHVTFDGYYAPRGFVLDGVPDLFSDSRGPDTIDNFISIVRERQKYPNPSRRSKGGPKINLLYSTPSCYVHHVQKSNATWGVKTDDFHPYGIAPGAYWTGYFTSRAGQKLLVKRASATLQEHGERGTGARGKGNRSTGKGEQEHGERGTGARGKGNRSTVKGEQEHGERGTGARGKGNRSMGKGEQQHGERGTGARGKGNRSTRKGEQEHGERGTGARVKGNRSTGKGEQQHGERAERPHVISRFVAPSRFVHKTKKQIG